MGAAIQISVYDDKIIVWYEGSLPENLTIITTNLAFDRWIEIFGDEVLTAAMVDRLAPKAILVNMNGQSFRVKESKKLLNF